MLVLCEVWHFIIVLFRIRFLSLPQRGGNENVGDHLDDSLHYFFVKTTHEFDLGQSLKDLTLKEYSISLCSIACPFRKRADKVELTLVLVAFSNKCKLFGTQMLKECYIFFLLLK